MKQRNLSLALAKYMHSFAGCAPSPSGVLGQRNINIKNDVAVTKSLSPITCTG